MNVRGERILIFGDSLSHPGLDASPTIQDVTQGSQRSSSAPGDLLASHLLEAGAAAARIDAKVGRSAISFFGNEPAQQLLIADRDFKPSKVIIMLGTNDAERDLPRTEASMIQLRDFYRSLGAEVWAIGPMTYIGRGAVLNAKAAQVFDLMQRVFGPSQTIDARPLSVIENRAGDGIHFQPSSAAATASLLAQALLTKQSLRMRPIYAVGLGFGVVFALGLLAWAIKRRNGALSGNLARASLDEVTTQIRDTIDGQIRTTRSGKKLVAYDAAAVENLRDNIVNNLAQGVDLLIDEALDEERGLQGKPISPSAATPSEDGYAYHATNIERAHSIADEGLKTHKPWEHTDQSEWPDGSTKPRIYFAPRASQVWAFAPEEGRAVVIRTKLGPHIKRESTNDLYATKKVDPSQLEILTDEGWGPITKWSKEDRGIGRISLLPRT